MINFIKKTIKNIKRFFDNTVTVTLDELGWLEISLCDNCPYSKTHEEKEYGLCVSNCKALKILRKKYNQGLLTEEEKKQICEGDYVSPKRREKNGI